METRTHEWQGPGGPFEGVLAFAGGRERRPGVLIAPTIAGPSDLEQAVAVRLAERGWVALVADVYGKGRRPRDMDEGRALMDPLKADRPLLAARMAAAHDALVAARGNVDPARTAVIGYCFGGMGALDLVRAGEPVRGAVTFHGLLDAPDEARAPIAAKLLVLHGWDDPLVPPAQVDAFAAEMTARGADWQLHAYGGTVHGFTNPKRPAMYSEVADRRSWAAAMSFLDEVLG